MNRLWFRSVSTTLVMLLSVSGHAQQEASADDAAEACGTCLGQTACMIAIPIVLILAVITSVIIAVWIYKDAHRRGDPKEMLWAILGLFLNVVGLGYYLYVVQGRGDPGSPPRRPPGSA